MKLKTPTYTPKTFTPVPYTPQQPDMSILQRSFERQEQRTDEALNAYNKLVKLCVETAKKMPPSENEWFRSYCDSICELVDTQIEIGNTQSAITLAYNLMSQLRRNKNVQYRIDSYKQYCDDMMSHGLYNYQNGRVTQTCYEWFCITNQYKFSPKYDSTGNLSGYEPVSVSYLYPSINWNEVYQFVTSQGRSKTDINRMWSLYFTSDKLSSLDQEFALTKFCYDYFISISNNTDLDPTDKEQIVTNIEKYRAILSDSNNQISYNAFVENLKKQYVIQPPSIKSTSLPKKKHYTKSKK